MKVLLSAVLTSYRRLRDRSVNVSFNTSEVGTSVIEVLDQIHQNEGIGVLYFRAEEKVDKDELEELDAVDLDLYDTKKSQGQRLRGVLYRNWEQNGEGEFKDYYKTETEKIINHYKSQLE